MCVWQRMGKRGLDWIGHPKELPTPRSPSGWVSEVLRRSRKEAACGSHALPPPHSVPRAPACAFPVWIQSTSPLLPRPPPRAGPASRRRRPPPPPLACPPLAAATAAALPPGPTPGDPAWSGGRPKPEVSSGASRWKGGADQGPAGAGGRARNAALCLPSPCAGCRDRSSSRQVPSSLPEARDCSGGWRGDPGVCSSLHMEPVAGPLARRWWSRP